MILNVNLPPGYVSLYQEHKIDLLYVHDSGDEKYGQNPWEGKEGRQTLKPVI